MTELKEKIKAAQIDLIKELGIDKLEPEQKEEIILQIGEILQQRVVMRVVEELADEKQDEFKEVLEKASENPQLVDEFLEKNVPGLQDMILEEIGEYKKGAVEFMNQALGEEKRETQDRTVQGVEEDDLQGETEDTVTENEGREVIEGFSETGEEVRGAEPEVELGPAETKEAILKDEPVESPVELKQSGNDKKEVSEPREDKISGIEQEQAEKEAQILEENKVDDSVIQGEELDLTNEIEKMGDDDNNKEK